jgi:hypothetical protein
MAASSLPWPFAQGKEDAVTRADQLEHGKLYQDQKKMASIIVSAKGSFKRYLKGRA